MEHIEEKCGTCWFFFEMSDGLKVKFDELNLQVSGLCKRYPPSGDESLFPAVNERTWCGEYLCQDSPPKI
jgi:hypothetical protein